MSSAREGSDENEVAPLVSRLTFAGDSTSSDEDEYKEEEEDEDGDDDGDESAPLASPITFVGESASLSTARANLPKTGRWVAYLMVSSFMTFPNSVFPYVPEELEERDPRQYELRGWSHIVEALPPKSDLASTVGLTLYNHLIASDPNVRLIVGDNYTVRMVHSGDTESGVLCKTQRGGIPTFASAHTNNNLDAGLITIVQAWSLRHRLEIKGLPPWDETPWNDRDYPIASLLHMSDLIFLNWEKANNYRAMHSPQVGEAAHGTFQLLMRELKWILLHPVHLASVLTDDILNTLWKVKKGSELPGKLPKGEVLKFNFGEEQVVMQSSSHGIQGLRADNQIYRAFHDVLMEMPIIKAVAFMLIQYRRHWNHRVISSIYVASDEILYESQPMILLKINEVASTAMAVMRTTLV